MPPYQGLYVDPSLQYLNYYNQGYGPDVNPVPHSEVFKALLNDSGAAPAQAGGQGGARGSGANPFVTGLNLGSSALNLGRGLVSLLSPSRSAPGTPPVGPASYLFGSPAAIGPAGNALAAPGLGESLGAGAGTEFGLAGPLGSGGLSIGSLPLGPALLPLAFGAGVLGLGELGHKEHNYGPQMAAWNASGATPFPDLQRAVTDAWERGDFDAVRKLRDYYTTTSQAIAAKTGLGGWEGPAGPWDYIYNPDQRRVQLRGLYEAGTEAERPELLRAIADLRGKPTDSRWLYRMTKSSSEGGNDVPEDIPLPGPGIARLPAMRQNWLDQMTHGNPNATFPGDATDFNITDNALRWPNFTPGPMYDTMMAGVLPEGSPGRLGPLERLAAYGRQQEVDRQQAGGQ